jgi:hypothetical protein
LHIIPYSNNIMTDSLTLKDVEEAVKDGDVKVVAAGLAQGGSAALAVGGAKDDWLAAACWCGHIEVVLLLLGLTGQRAVDVHAKKERAFYLACSAGHTAVVVLLLGLGGERKVNVHVSGEYAFRMACFYDRIKVVELLLSLGGARAVNVHVANDKAFHQACMDECTQVIALLMCHRGADGAAAAATLRRHGKWGYVEIAGKEWWCSLRKQPRWLAAVRRSGAMAARAVRRRSRVVSTQYNS